MLFPTGAGPVPGTDQLTDAGSGTVPGTDQLTDAGSGTVQGAVCLGGYMFPRVRYFSVSPWQSCDN